MNFYLFVFLLGLIIKHFSHVVISLDWRSCSVLEALPGKSLKFNELIKWFTSCSSDTDIARNSRIRILCEPLPSKAFWSLPWEFPLLCLVGVPLSLAGFFLIWFTMSFIPCGHLAEDNFWVSCFPFPSCIREVKLTHFRSMMCTRSVIGEALQCMCIKFLFDLILLVLFLFL